MPPLESAELNQKAVLWRKTGNDRKNRPILGSPEEISCRWEEGQVEGITPLASPTVYEANVVVAEDLPEGSVLWEGELTDWVGTGSGNRDAGLMEIVKKSKVPDVRAREFRYTIFLNRYGGRITS